MLLPGAVSSHSLPAIPQVKSVLGEVKVHFHALGCVISQWENGSQRDSHSPSPILGIYSQILVGPGHVSCPSSSFTHNFGVFPRFSVDVTCSLLDNT